MAESAVTFLLEKLKVLVENETRPLRFIREEFVYLRGELERLRAFLRDADAWEEGDEELKVWVKQVREIAQDAEDVLDELLLLQAHDHGDEVNAPLRRLSCCIKNIKARYRITWDLQGINSRIRDISKDLRRLKDKLKKAEQDCVSNGAGNVWQDSRGDALLLDKSNLVGIEKPKEQLIKWLVNVGSGREVISLTGMGGMGKTTLAKQVYDDPEVKKHFKIHAWITVSQSFKEQELLRDMVQQLYKVIRRPLPEELDDMDRQRLKETIKDLLSRKRYLVVLDDIWHLYEWDAVKYSLPNNGNGNGSKIMITTRNSDIAFTSGVDSFRKVYNLEPLPPQESWELFCRRTFNGNLCPPYLEEICKYILRKCEGLPLAIVAISGVLATKSKRRIDEWEMVGRSLGSMIEGNDKLKDLKKVLSLSFNDLPYYLKSCFLYLSIFPEDHLIEHARLIRLWIAEGFIDAKEGKTLEEVAEDYFNELLSRSLMQVARTTADGRVKTCRVHDLLRETIISKSRDQNFATSAREQNVPWPEKIRRLSIHYTLQNVQQNRSVSQLRSLFMFGVAEKPCMNKLFPGGFRLLNVLDLQNLPLKKFPSELADLYYLKYLSLRNTRVKTIPRFIGKFQYMETLDLKHSCVSELPVEILKLHRLRHILIYRVEYESFLHFHPKYGFKAPSNIGALRSLQKLCFIEADQNGEAIMTEVGRLIQLRRLGILKLRKEDGKRLCSTIEKLISLRALSITAIEENEIIDLQHLSSPPLLIQRLYLRGRLESLPQWIHSLHSLVRLHLKWSRLKDDPLVFLQHLPNLVHLELLQVCDGNTLSFKSGGFKKLKFLAIDGFDELRNLKVEEGAMACVEKLIIQRCKLLWAVPSGIEHLTKLKVLEFFDMPVELIKALLHPDENGGDFHKVAFIPEVYITMWEDGGWKVHSLESFGDKDSSPQPFIKKEFQSETRLK